MPSHPEAVVICLRATARQITTIFICHPTKKRSRNASSLQPGNFRPFPIHLHQTFGRKMPRCCSPANRDRFRAVSNLIMVAKCHAVAAWQIATIPTCRRATNGRKLLRCDSLAFPDHTCAPPRKQTVEIYRTAPIQRFPTKRQMGTTAIPIRHWRKAPDTTAALIEARRTLNTSVRRPKHHAAMSTPDKVFPAARQTHPAAE